MKDDSTLYVGLDVHKKSITIAYAIDMANVELYGKTTPTRANVDRLRERLRSKAHHLRVVYEAGPCGYGLYRQLIAHRRWLSSCSFPNAWQQFAFEEHRRSIEDRLAQCERLETALHEAVADWRFYPVALRTCSSQLMAWLSIHRETNVAREASPRLATALPASCSSKRHGVIDTRRVSVRSSSSGRSGYRNRSLIGRGDAQLRLCRRFQKFVARGKNVNIAVVAVARELAGFMWDIGRLAMSLALPRNGQPA